MPRQTAARPAELSGHGLFSGRPCSVTVAPAAAGKGITFHQGLAAIPVHCSARVATARRTTLAAGAGRVETVEHLLAAVVALGYDDLDVAVTGGEIPIGDGGFLPFVDLLHRAGIAQHAGRRRLLALAEPVAVAHGDAAYRVDPAPALSLDVSLEYAQPVIGTQRFQFAGGRERFVTDVAPARTFGFMVEIERAQAQGELLGAVDGTGIALDATAVRNTTLHWPDEFARHKTGDLLGDLALLGAPLAARITARRPSHDGNFACVQAILAAAHYREE